MKLWKGNFIALVLKKKKMLQKRFSRKIKLAWLYNWKLSTVGIQKLFTQISVKLSEGFQLPLTNQKQDRVLMSTPNILPRSLQWLCVVVVTSRPLFKWFRKPAAVIVRVTVWVIYLVLSDLIKKFELLGTISKKASLNPDCLQKAWQRKLGKIEALKTTTKIKIWRGWS